jgi:large repetitive protein
MSHLFADRPPTGRVRRLAVRISSAIVLAAIAATGVSVSVAQAATPPSAPTGLTAVPTPAEGLKSGEVKLSWSAPTSIGGSPITDYVIEQTIDTRASQPTKPLEWTVVDDGVSTATTYTVKGLMNGKDYLFTVSAKNAAGEGPQSGMAGARPVGVPPAPSLWLFETYRGLAPDALRIGYEHFGNGGSDFTASTLEKSSDGVTWASVPDWGFNNGGLTPGARYYFRLSLSNGYGDSPWSNVVSGVPGKPGPIDLKGAIAPTAGVGSGEVKLSWTTPTSGAPITDYILEHRMNIDEGLDWTPWTTVDDGVSGATNAFTVGGLTNGKLHSFRIYAINSIGKGEWSPELLVRPVYWPGTPVGLSAFAVRAGEVKLTWTAPDDGGSAIYDYVIQRSTDGTTWTTVTEPISSATSVTVTGLTQGTTYKFRVAAYNALGAGPWTTPVTAVAPVRPAAPTGLKADPKSGAIRLSWDAAPAGTLVENYYVDYCCESGEWIAADDGTLTATALTITGLTDGVTYKFRVAANNAAGASSWTSPLSSTAGGPPPAPSGLTAAVAPAAGVGSGEVKLSWTAPTAGSAITDYVIESSTDGTTWTTVDDGVSQATTATVRGLTNFSSYQFRVAAKNGYGIGDRSALVTATPAGAPLAPTGLAAAVAPAAGLSAGQVRLKWDAPLAVAAVTDYVIELSTDGSTWTTVADGVSTATEYTIGGLANGTEYSFRVAAKNGYGAGPNATVKATPPSAPAAPIDLATSAGPNSGVGSGEVQLTWAAPNTTGGLDITDYAIETSTDGIAWTAVDDGVSTNTTFVVNGLTNGIGYSFRVAAVNGAGRGPWSVKAQAVPTTLAAAPVGLTATVAPAPGVGPGEVELTWGEPDGGGLTIVDYVIEDSIDGTTWETMVDELSPATTFRATGLVDGTAYHFRVAAVTDAGPGTAATVDATPAWNPGGPGGLQTAVAPAAGVGSGQVKLVWVAPAGNGSAITDYVIERSIDGTTWTAVGDGVSTATTATVQGLTNGTAYGFRVAAQNAVGQGEWSATSSATPRWRPGAPGGLRARAGAGRVTLSWRVPASNGSAVTDYVIQRTTGTRWSTVRDGVSTARSYTVTRLTNRRQYRFRVAAKNVLGQGAWSAIARATPFAR